MEAVVSILHIGFLFWLATWLYKSFHASPMQVYYAPALLFKFFASIAVGLIYKYYYQGGDTFAYFHDAVILSDLFFQNPGAYLKAVFLGIYPEGLIENLLYLEQERALLTAKILSFFTLVTDINYWISGLYFSFLTFLGMFYLANQVNKFVQVPKIVPAIAFLFFPSVVFWSSGVLKEPLVMGCLCLIIAFYIPFLLENKKPSLLKILLSVLLAWLLWEIKYYYAAVLFPLLLAGLLTTYIQNQIAGIENNFLMQAGIALILFTAFIVSASFLHPNLNMDRVLAVIVRNYHLEPVSSNLIHFNDLQPTVGSFVKNLPLALFSGLFRPTFFDADTLFQYYVAFENALLLLLFIPALYNFKKLSAFDHKLPVFLLIIYILLLAIILPMASPNLGTLARHKIGFLPFFIYLLMACNPLLVRITLKFRIEK